MTGDECVHLVGVFEHVGVAESLVNFLELGEKVHDGLHALADNLDDGLVGVEVRFLLKIAYGISGSEHYFAAVVFVDTGDDFKKRRFTRAVQTDDTDLGTIEKRQVNLFKNLFLGWVNLAYTHHREYYFFIVSHFK